MRRLIVNLLAAAFLIAGCKAKEGEGMGIPNANAQGGGQTPPVEKVLNSPVAGSWYTSDGAALAREIQGYLDRADVGAAKADLGVVALVAPHAGYRYSGGVAAHGFKLLAGQDVKRVVVIGPSHRVGYRGIALTDATKWRTPMGDVPIDTEAVKALAASKPFAYRTDVWTVEHSVDIEVPFIQAVAPHATLVPIVVGHVDPGEVREAAKAIRGLLDGHTVLVASSDFTHYGPNYGYMPFHEDVEARLKGLADEAIAAILAVDVDAFAAHVEKTGDTICGEAPIRIVMSAVPKRVDAKLLKFDTSGHITGDFENSVSYVSLAYTNPPLVAQFRSMDIIPEADRKLLLWLARETVRRLLAGRSLPDPEAEGRKLSDKLKQDFGVFVTLKEHGDLRGCIGSIMPVEPLWKGVIRNAVNAAIHDPRFPAMTAAEEPLVDIEISVLSPPKEVDGPQDIVLGRDGVLLTKGSSRAVFLPQVAPEQEWDLETMLTHLSMKAGLPGGAWKAGTTFEVFQAHVFGERE